MVRKIRTLVALFLVCSILMGSTVVFASPEADEFVQIAPDTGEDNFYEADPDEYLKLSQGLDVYETSTMTKKEAKEWMEAQPTYSGIMLDDKIDKKALKDLNFKKELKTISKSLANGAAKNSDEEFDPRFHYWKNARMTEEVEILNYDGSVYGYLYGVVYHPKQKLVGYIITGACEIAPPILEYSVEEGKYLFLKEQEQVYFGRNTGLTYKNGNELISLAEGDTVCDISDIGILVDDSTPSNEVQKAIEQQWEVAPGYDDPAIKYGDAETFSGSTYISIDTSDYAWYNLCSPTALAMWVDAVGRRVEPALLSVDRPHSIKLNDYFYSKMNKPRATFPEVRTILNDYISLKKRANLAFTTYYLTEEGGSSTASALFSQHKTSINNKIPTLVGYNVVGVTNPDGTSKAHIMLGVGYNASNNFYICRDTWINDGKPFGAFMVNWTGVDYYLIGATFSGQTWGTQTLRKGDSSSEVYRLEVMLKALYYNPGTVNSVFDTDTENAVKAFQADNGLTADGIVGSGTYNKLKTAHIMKYDRRTASTRVLSEGKRGDDVAQLQYRLKDMGLYTGAVDGIFGSGTKAAVIKFQQKYSDLTNDGMAGSATMLKLVYSTWTSK